MVSATGYEDLEEGIDTINATLYYPGDLTVVITGGWHHKKAYPFSMEYTVTADGATFEFNSIREEATVYGADGEARPLTMPQGDAFAAELQYFVDCCRSGQTPEMSPPEESAISVKLTRLLTEARKLNGDKLPCTL
jgi:predicted dehydrogenase